MHDPYLSNPHAVPLRAERNDLVSLAQAEQVHELALKILSRIGLEILPEDLRAHMAQAGFAVHGNRAYFEPQVVEEYVSEMRRRVSTHTHQPETGPATLRLAISLYPHHLHDLESDQVVLYTRESLAQMVRLIDTFADEGVDGAAPGYILDEPAEMQPVTQYLVAAENARQGCYPVDTTSPATASYIFEMAEVMGHPIRSLPVYLPTPLRLGGESLEIVMANLHRLDHISVSSMPATGANAPITPLAAFALSAAELIGGMITLRVVTGKPVSFHAGVLPFDLHSMAMVYGSPENLLFHLAASDLNRFYGYAPFRGGGNIHVMAKLPGAQSAAEKAAIMTAGALLGARHFSCAGALSLDEIFSPEQLLIDVEIRNWVQRLLAGIDTQLPGDDLLAEIEASLTDGFTAQDRTLDNYQRLFWYPHLFERDFMGPWQQAGSPRFRDRVRQEIAERLARPSFQLDDTRRREMRRIWEAARAHVSAM